MAKAKRKSGRQPANKADARMAAGCARLVRQQREKLGLSMEDVAKKLGLRSQTIYSLETRSMNLTTLARFARLYGCEMRDLVPLRSDVSAGRTKV